MTVLVHGCKGSAGRFRSLAQLYVFHGQQAVCFSYDDRKRLVRSASQLVAALDALASRIRDRDVTLIGHSMGGLLARKALESELQGEWRGSAANIKLVTVSAPLAGIESARKCGNTVLHWVKRCRIMPPVAGRTSRGASLRFVAPRSATSVASLVAPRAACV